MFRIQACSTFCEIYAQLNRPLKLRCWRVLAFAGVVSLLELAITAALSLLGMALAAPEQILALCPALISVVQEQKRLLLWLLSSLCVALACKSLSLAFLTWRQAVFSQEAGVYFSVRFYKMLLNAPYLWHVQQDMSMLQTRLTWARFSADFLLAFLQAAGQMLAACVLIAVVAAATPWAALLVCLCTGTSAGLTYYLAQRKVRYLNAVSMETEAGANRVAYPSLAGIREVKIYGQERAFLQQFTLQRQKFAKVQSMLPVVYPAPAWILDLTGMLILLVALLVLDGIGQLTVLAAVTWRILPTVNTLVSCLLQVQQHMVYTQDAVRFIAEMSQNSAAQAEGKNVALKPLHLQTQLELREVAFRYPDTPVTSPDALHSLNIQIPYGAMVGFIGTSGAGKSTVVGLLTGLLTPTRGQVLVDGQPLDNAHKTAWLHAIGYVPQTPFLLNASIAANVAFTKWGQKIDYEQVKRCCQMAAIDFLDNLPDGLETIIGERGVRLSGGQVQRIAIARALYNQPRLILFDEATSALDGASEQTIQRTIETLEGHATLVLVAHRLTTVKNCDYLYWLGKGTIHMAGQPAVVLPEYEAYLQSKSLHTSLCGSC